MSGGIVAGAVMARHNAVIRVTQVFPPAEYELVPRKSRCWLLSEDSAPASSLVLEARDGGLLLSRLSADEAQYAALLQTLESRSMGMMGVSCGSLLIDAGKAEVLPDVGGAAAGVGESQAICIRKGPLGGLRLRVGSHETVLSDENAYGYWVLVEHGPARSFLLIRKGELVDGHMIDVLTRGTGCDVELRKGFLGRKWTVSVQAYTWEPVPRT